MARSDLEEFEGGIDAAAAELAKVLTANGITFVGKQVLAHVGKNSVYVNVPMAEAMCASAPEHEAKVAIMRARVAAAGARIALAMINTAKAAAKQVGAWA